MINYYTYYTTNIYEGRGVQIQVVPQSMENKRSRWDLRFSGSKLWFRGFKNKFEAMLFASWKMRRSMEKMRWEPR